MVNISLTNSNHHSGWENYQAGAAMSKIELTTQDIFQRLASTAHSRSARADVLFRRLRFTKQDQIAEALMRAPRMLDASAIDDIEEKRPQLKRKRAKKKT
jgi:predicted secreted protein